MHVTVTFKQMDSTDALKSYAEEKSLRLGKYLFEPVEVHWVLSVEKIRHIAEATIVAKNLTIKAQSSTGEMYSAIDDVLEKLERQVRRHKEKIKRHKFSPEETSSVRYPSALGGAGRAEAPRTRGIVKTENVFVKPMSIEEASMQIEVNNSPFLVFTDSETSNINVLYRREDGNLGLIEARPAPLSARKL